MGFPDNRFIPAALCWRSRRARANDIIYNTVIQGHIWIKGLRGLDESRFTCWAFGLLGDYGSVDELVGEHQSGPFPSGSCQVMENV